MLDAVIFDLDGTLLYTLEDLHDSVNFALSKFGYKKRTLHEIRSFVGNGVKKLMERSIPNGVLNSDFEECLTIFKEHYAGTGDKNTHPYEGVLELLKTLKENNIKCAVVSNKFDSAVKDLCKKYFDEYIDVAIGESDSVRKKPAPDSVIKVIDILGAKKVVYVGDSEVDIQTAQNANIPCISVSWGYKDVDFLEQNNAQYIVHSASQLCDTLMENF